MAINTNNSIPSNIRETLMKPGDAEGSVFFNKRTYNKTFNETYGNVLTSMHTLHNKTRVCVSDTHGKSGFSAFGQILSNIWHNFKALFQSDGEARTALTNAVQDLEKFSKYGKIDTITKDDKAQLQALLSQIKNVKKEWIENWQTTGALTKVQQNYVILAKQAESTKDTFENHINNLRTKLQNYKTENDLSDDAFNKEMSNSKSDIGKVWHEYQLLKDGKPLEKFTLRVLQANPSDKKAIEALKKDYEVLKDSKCGNCTGKRQWDSAFGSVFFAEGKTGAPTLADRLETALQKIAKT